MGNDFSSTPYDGHHDVMNGSGDDWRSKTGIGGMWDRLTSYGNFAGPGNRIEVEQGAYVKQQHDKDPNYSEYHDPKLQADPRYRPIDGVDAAAAVHDEGYSKHLGDASMFGWQGLRNVHDDDRTLVRSTQAEMDANGSKYSSEAKLYTEGERGFFGGRVMGMDAVDWTANKANQASQGVSDFAHSMGQSTSLSDAASRFGDGASSAGSWLKNTAGQAWNGISGAAEHAHDMGWAGMAGTVAGLGNVAGAGALELGTRAVNGVENGLGAAWNGASNLAHQAGTAVANTASQAWDGTKNLANQAGTAVANTASQAWDGTKNLANQAGTAISNGASTLASGASNLAHSAAHGVEKAWDVATSW